MEWKSETGKRLRLVTGDITRIAVDTMANAANAALAGGGGVDGAIHQAGGPTIMLELDEIRAKIGGCPTGCAVVTGAGNLPAKYVFHAVGPVYRDGKHGEPELLAGCYRKCLELAEALGVRTISFPSISTGVYGYPVKAAAGIAVREIAAHLRGNGVVQEVVMVLFSGRDYEIYAGVARQDLSLPLQ
ncbi:MAG: macro domain-containing protein [Acidobacteriota bacterium]|nr:macro domain-containing protein [Acidobacteriota bacterium]